MSENNENDFLPNLKDLATSLAFKWIDLSCDFAEKLWELISKVKKWYDKAIDWTTYLKSKPLHKDSFNMDQYAEAIANTKKINIEITIETRRKIINFVDFFWEELNDWLFKELNNLIDWNPDMNKLLACMTIDSEDKENVYKYLIPILQEIKIS